MPRGLGPDAPGGDEAQGDEGMKGVGGGWVRGDVGVVLCVCVCVIV